MSDKFIYKYLNKEELKSISSKISEIENKTSGELVITIKEKRNLFEKHKSIRSLAEEEFADAGISKTKSGTGILFFMIFNAREFCILADKSINEKVGNPVWDEIAEEISYYFRQGNYCGGILYGIEKAGGILAAYFPAGDNNRNELSNEIRIT